MDAVRGQDGGRDSSFRWLFTCMSRPEFDEDIAARCQRGVRSRERHRSRTEMIFRAKQIPVCLMNEFTRICYYLKQDTRLSFL